MPVADINGVKLNYMQLDYQGEGPAEDLVMLHGLAANMAFWLQDYAPHFAQRFRVTLYDLRGLGRSQSTHDGYTPDDMFSDLCALMDGLGIGKAHIMAHSFGGLAALKLASAHPERVLSLVLADTQIQAGREAVKGLPWKVGDAIQKALNRAGMVLDVRDPYFGFHLITAIARFRREGKDIPESIQPWVQHVLDGNNRRTAEKWLLLMEDTQALSEFMQDDGLTAIELRKISCPVLALYGENSQAMATAGILAPLWPQAEFVTIPGAGHFFPRANPPLVMSLCDRFWDGKSRQRKTA